MHTPGPWFVLPDSPPAIRDMTGANIAPEVCHMADARLIAKAPDMLDVLRRVADFWAGGDVPEDLDRDIRALLED